MPQNEQSLWFDFLSQSPETGYYSQPEIPSFTPNQRRVFENSYNDIFNEYQGALGRQIRMGEDPTLRWTDYLQQNPFIERYGGMLPSERRERPEVFSPPTRWLV